MKRILEKIRKNRIIREENHQLRTIIDSVPACIYWKNKQGVYQGYNAYAAEKMHTLYLGSSNNKFSIIGKTDFDLFPEEMAQKFYDNDQIVLTTKKELSVEEVTTLPDGQQLVQLSIKTPLYNSDGEVSGIIGNTIDITQLKQTEEKLRLAAKQAQESNLLKTEFIRNIEHDIRTPFNGLCTLAKTLAIKETDPKKQQQLTMMSESAQELLMLCNQIVKFSKEESQEMSFVNKNIELRILLDNLIKMEKVATTAKGLKLNSYWDPQLPRVITTDPYRLRAILINLLSNAIKFTTAGEVNMRAKLYKLMPDQKTLIIEFSIQDTGVGIPASQTDHIYERFHRLTPSNRGLYRGQGLGLYIVKKYVTELEGEIHVNSEIGQGTTFLVYLPITLPLADIIDPPSSNYQESQYE